MTQPSTLNTLCALAASASLLTMTGTLSGCGSDSSSDSGAAGSGVAASADVSLDFSVKAGSTPVTCGTSYTLGSADTSVQIKDLRLYIHDVTLLLADDSTAAVTLDASDWQSNGVALLDFEDASGGCAGNSAMNTQISGSYTASADVTGIRFQVGVPAALNHENNASAPSPLNVLELFWSWQNGYKFMRFDFLLDEPVGDLTGWFVHLGSTDCAAEAPYSCGRNNRVQVTLDNFDPDSQSVVIDLANLLANSNLSANAGGAKGCMSAVDDPECNDIFSALGLDLNTGSSDSAYQMVFRAE